LQRKNHQYSEMSVYIAIHDELLILFCRQLGSASVERRVADL